jgi:hypothetical protein
MFQNGRQRARKATPKTASEANQAVTTRRRL